MLAFLIIVFSIHAEVAVFPPPPTAVRAEVTSRDGLRLSYVRYGNADGPDPVIVSPGRGESAYRYEDLANQLIGRGFGPVYVLEHRGQGFSARTIENKDLVHVDHFTDYATDLIDFIKSVVRKPPLLIAHSMGGAIANLALLKEPTLARRVVYIAPMLDINTSWMNPLRDRPAYWLAQLLCAAGFCDEVALAKTRRPGPHQPPSLRREQAEGIFTTGVTPGWLKEAIATTWSLRDHAAAHHEASLFLIAKYDRLVQNEAIRAYACRASNCQVEEIAGPHSLHLSESAKVPLEDAIVRFFRSCVPELL